MIMLLRETLLEPGAVAEIRSLGWEVEAPPEGSEIPIDLGDDQRIVRLRRLHLVGGEPVLLQEIFLPHALCHELAEADLATLPALELLASRCGARVTAVRESFDAVVLGEEEAAHLGAPAGSPALLHERTVSSGDARVLHERTVKRHGGARFLVDLKH
jgi:GntR family transcriptional regulator